ncbi:MAG: UDP-N-acetylmuramoyl-L-alanine--D-glutamate ligase, partial [Firmicutes bacterium]|nr:UDP-N-acetylmuramoyl-L-alanine--D-glutamate ligase [Bacillota bacterium]
VGITGTNGKTTTTTLVGEIFRASGRTTNVVGNIGLPVISVATNSKPKDWMITEVSSFQLQTVSQFRPRVSAILNLTPDHLNRHHTMELYGAAKAAIWENQKAGDYLVMNIDDPVLMKLCLYDVDKEFKGTLVGFSRKTEPEVGAFLKDDRLVIKDEEGRIFDLIHRDELRIPGDHNVENALAAAAICFFAGIDTETIINTLKAFGGVEHRLEFVKDLSGVSYYNDSKGTNTDATLIAIRALKENIILIAGGDAKSQDFTEMAKELHGPVKHVLLFGRDRGMIKEALDKAGYTSYSEHSDLGECVKRAHDMAVAGDKVLLSPACASWDMYPNFEVRGKHFKDLVNEL